MRTTIVDQEQPAVRTDSFAAVQAMIKTKRCRFGVIGLGYVGLPLGLTLNQAGFDVTGIDIDTKRVNAIHSGRSYITDVSELELQNALRDGRFRATTDLAVIRELDCISICVPTPLRKTKDPDMSYIIAAADAIAKELRPGQLVILESTTYPGT